jgi:hypothetical protein
MPSLQKLDFFDIFHSIGAILPASFLLPMCVASFCSLSFLLDLAMTLADFRHNDTLREDGATNFFN